MAWGMRSAVRRLPQAAYTPAVELLPPHCPPEPADTGKAESPRRTVDVFGTLFARAIDNTGELLGMATGEGVAHLNHLLVRGEAVRETGADGVYRYRLK